LFPTKLLFIATISGLGRQKNKNFNYFDWCMNTLGSLVCGGFHYNFQMLNIMFCEFKKKKIQKPESASNINRKLNIKT